MIRELSQTTIDEYASDIGATKEQPVGEDYTLGAKVGKTIPAKWWNWLFSATTKRVMQGRNDTQDIFTEMKNVLVDAGIEPNPADNTQLAQAVKVKAEDTLERYIQSKGTTGESWQGENVSFNVPQGYVWDVHDMASLTVSGSINRVVYGNNVFVGTTTIVMNSHVNVLYSLDGINWSLCSGLPDTWTDNADVTFFKFVHGVFFLGVYPTPRSSTRVYSSVDGINWRTCTYTEYDVNQELLSTDIVWNGTAFTALEHKAGNAYVYQLLQSSDGEHFTVAKQFGNEDDRTYGAVQNFKGYFKGNYYFESWNYSTQKRFIVRIPEDFTSATIIPGLEDTSSYSGGSLLTVYITDTLILLGNRVSVNPTYLYSLNGVDFSEFNSWDFTGYRLQYFKEINNKYFMTWNTNNSTRTIVSNDFSNWVDTSMPVGRDILYSNEQYTTANSNHVFISNDGINWMSVAYLQNSAGRLPDIGWMFSVSGEYVFFSPVMVAYSKSTEMNPSYLLTDDIGVHMLHRTLSPEMYVCGGIISSNGKIIYAFSSLEQNVRISNIFKDNNYMFLLTDQNPRRIITVRLSDKSANVAVDISGYISGSAKACKDVGCINGLYYLVTSNGAIVSTDPYDSWTSIYTDSDAKRLLYFKDNWVLVTANKVLYSNDLQSWEEADSLHRYAYVDAACSVDRIVLTLNAGIFYTDDLVVLHQVQYSGGELGEAARIYHHNNAFIIISKVGILYSYEGVEWLASDYTQSLTDTFINGVQQFTFNNNYVLCLAQGVFVASNLKYWHKSPDINFKIYSFNNTPTGLKLSGYDVIPTQPVGEEAPEYNSYFSIMAGINTVIHHKLYLR